MWLRRGLQNDCAAQHLMAMCLEDQLEWLPRKCLNLFSIHSAKTSLDAIMSHATCKPSDQAGWGPKSTVIKQNKCKMYVIAVLQEVSICLAWEGMWLLVVSLILNFQNPEESSLISLCNFCAAPTKGSVPFA